MAVKWQDALWKAAEEIMRKGGRVEFIVYKREEKRRPVVRRFPDNEVCCEEEILVD